MGRWLSLIRLAVANLWVNWFRSSLTVLGMVFGTGAVIATLSSNEGAMQYISKELKSLGTNVVNVSTNGLKSFLHTDMQVIKKYSQLFSGVSLVSELPPLEARGGTRLMPVRVMAVGVDYFESLQAGFVGGRSFLNAELEQLEPVAVLGSQVKQKLFPTKTANGEFVVLQLKAGKSIVPFALRVIGVLQEKGGSSGDSTDQVIFVPHALANKLAPRGVQMTRLIGTLKDDDQSALARSQIRALLGPKFGETLSVTDSREAIETTKNIWEKQNFVGICLAVVSLLTGGVGIMNIMLLSIHQRRKEIGLRKALGAKNYDICIQFLMESTIICLIGGVIGIFGGWIFGRQVASMLGQWEAVTNYNTIGLALGFSLATGVLFGLAPALRASRLDPYDALRT